MKACHLQIWMMEALAAAAVTADELQPWLERSNGIFSVHEAAAVGDMSALVAATADKAGLNMTDEKGNTALDIAAAAGHAEAVQHLIGAGAAATERTLAAAATPAIRKMVMGAVTARRLELQLCEGVASGNVPEVRKLLALGVSPNALTNDHQMSVLMQAAGAGKVWMVRILLENGANPNYVSPQSKTVLHVAAAGGTGEVVTRLLAAGADPLAQGSNGATALHDAVWCRNTETVKALLHAYRAQNFNPDGQRNGLPLTMAVRDGNRAIVKLFLEAGTDLRHPQFEAQPPLIEAVLYGRVEIARMLLAAGADPDARDADGKSARDYAVVKMPGLFK